MCDFESVFSISGQVLSALTCLWLEIANAQLEKFFGQILASNFLP